MRLVKPRVATLLAVVVALAVRSAYAAPAVAIAQVKAAHCCGKNCDHGDSAPRPDDCCQVASHAGDAATLSVSSPLDHVSASSHFVPASPFRVLAADSASRALTSLAASGGPPLFLRLRSLQP